MNVLSWEVGRHRQSLPLMVRRTMSFSAAPRFDEQLVGAVREFYGLSMDVTTAEAEILEDEDERIRFFPWFLWDWRPDADTPTVGEAFLEQGEHPVHERRLMEALCASYVGFYEALEDASAAGADVRDLLTDEILHVDDDGLTGELFAGQILQARLIRVRTSGQPCVLVDAVYAIIPAEGRGAVELELQSLPAGPGGAARVMESFACEMIEAAEQILEDLSRPPVTTNADGERMVLARCAWRGQAAVDVLEALPGAATFHALDGDAWQWRLDGEPRGWVHRPASGRLDLGAASPERLDELLLELSELAGVSPPPVRSLTDFPTAAEDWVRTGGGETWLRALPEVRAAARAWLSGWPRDWVEVPWPELGDRTLAEAVGLADGRRAVRELLARIERMQGDPVAPLALGALRERLGLDR